MTTFTSEPMWRLYSLAAHAASVSCHDVLSLNFSLASLKRVVASGSLPCLVNLPLQCCVVSLDTKQTENEAPVVVFPYKVYVYFRSCGTPDLDAPAAQTGAAAD